MTLRALGVVGRLPGGLRNGKKEVSLLKKSKANMRKEAERGTVGQYSPGFLFSILGPVLY